MPCITKVFVTMLPEGSAADAIQARQPCIPCGRAGKVRGSLADTIRYLGDGRPPGEPVNVVVEAVDQTGAPVAGAHVRFYRRGQGQPVAFGETDEAGRFRARVPGGRSYAVSIEAPGRVFPVQSLRV